MKGVIRMNDNQIRLASFEHRQALILRSLKGTPDVAARDNADQFTLEST
ncbi:MAG: hypothetical protein ABIU29_07730 [Chthoniobacterales bacterium]